MVCSKSQTVEQTMESHAQSVEDNLIDSLSFKLRPGASYVTDRKSSTFFSQGNQFSPARIKVIKMMLNGSDWMDPSTVTLFMNVANDDNRVLITGIVPNSASNRASDSRGNICPILLNDEILEINGVALNVIVVSFLIILNS